MFTLTMKLQSLHEPQKQNMRTKLLHGRSINPNVLQMLESVADDSGD